MGHVRKQMISFFVTAECNLNCKYCYIPKLKIKDQHKVIDLEFARRGIDDFFRDYPSRTIRFYGAGEPTVGLNLMEKIRDYAHEITKENLKIELQTNGVFSERVKNWVSSYVDILWVSCDGPPKFQNYLRPTKRGKETAKCVEDTITHFVEQPEIFCGVRTTIVPQTVKKQCEIIEYFHELGVKAVCAEAVVVPVGREMDSEFKVDPLEFAKNFLIAHKRALELEMFYSCLPMVNFDEEVRHACRACVPYPHLTTDGHVSCCDIAQFGPEYSPSSLQQLIYGKYDPVEKRIFYDEEKIFRIRSRCVEVLKQGACKNCSVLFHCAGGCVGQVVNETGNLFGVKTWSCEATRYLAKNLSMNKGLYPFIHS